MALTHLKTASKTPETESGKAHAVVSDMLARIEAEGEDVVRAVYKWDGPIVVTREELEAPAGEVLEQVREDIAFAAGAVRRLALAQMALISEFELTMGSGPRVVQKMIPCNVAGCYVPAGRYACIASDCMSVATAKAAGVKTVIACSTPFRGGGIHPCVLHAMKVAEADIVITLGGVQAIAAMEAHARTADARMTKSCPGHNFGLGRPVKTVA